MIGNQKTVFNKTLFIREYALAGGNVTKAASNANLNRQHYYTWFKLDVDFRNEIKLLDQRILRFVECNLLLKAKQGNIKALISLHQKLSKRQ